MGNRWGNSGNSVRLYFLVLKNLVYADCSLEIKRHLLLVKNAMIKLENILKSKDI